MVHFSFVDFTLFYFCLLFVVQQYYLQSFVEIVDAKIDKLSLRDRHPRYRYLYSDSSLSKYYSSANYLFKHTNSRRGARRTLQSSNLGSNDVTLCSLVSNPNDNMVGASISSSACFVVDVNIEAFINSSDLIVPSVLNKIHDDGSVEDQLASLKFKQRYTKIYTEMWFIS